jgi:hypothetical protein
MDPILYPHAYEDDDGCREAIKTLNMRPANASYRLMDGLEMASVKRMTVRTVGREVVEKHLRWQYWHISGRNTFVIGPETTARIMERVKAGDVPTEPVPPAYFEFEEPPVNYAASRRLRAAFVYRGVVGRITFMPDPPRTQAESEDMSLTVYLPSVFADRDLDHLKKGMSATRGVGHASKDALALARAMSDSVGGLDEEALMASASRMEALGRTIRGRDDDASMDLAATLFDRVYGPAPHRPNPLLPKAARVVLVAADEARRADTQYGEPRYKNGSQLERNWGECADHQVQRRADVVRLP